MNKHAKRLFVGLFSAIMVSPTAVMADNDHATKQVDTTVGTIDKTKTGSITLYKYIDNDGVSADADGVSPDIAKEQMEQAIRDQLGNQEIFAEKGVRFKLLKVADIEQVTNNEDNAGGHKYNVTGTYYTNIDSEFFETMNRYLGDYARLTPSTSTKSIDNANGGYDKGAPTVKAHYESDELNAKMLQVNRAKGSESQKLVTGEVALNRIVRQRAETNDQEGYCKSFDLTDQYGWTSLDDLPLGLYLVAEIDYEHSAISKHDTYWEYVDDQYEDAIGDNARQNGNTSVDDKTKYGGKTEDAEVSTDDGLRQTQNGTDPSPRNSSTSAGKDAGGSSYADIVSPSSPFLISVPTTNTTAVYGSDNLNHEAGTVWQYDITAYPKNGTLTIHKDIIVNNYATHGTIDGGLTNDGNDDNTTETLCDFNQTNYTKAETKSRLNGDVQNGLTHQIDANIGDIITQLVSVDVPRLVDDIDDEEDRDNATNNTKKGESTNTEGVNNSDNPYRKHNKTFIITDRMTKGLNLINHDPEHFTVTLSQGTWLDGGTPLTQGVDYNVKFDQSRTSYVLTLTQSGLAKLDNIPTASYLYIKYDTVLTKDALIGTDTYGDEVTITRNNNTAAAKDANVVNDTQANASNEGTNNRGVTEEQVKDGTSVDTDTHTTGGHYDSTYKVGPTKNNEETVAHADATNQNTAELTYATDRTQEHDYYSNTVKVFTYELDLTKLFTDGTQGNVSKHDTTGTHDNNREFDYSKVKFTVRGATQSQSDDGKRAANANSDGSVNHAYGYESITVNDIDRNNNKRTGADGNTTWEQMLFIKTGDGTYRVWDPLTDNNAHVNGTNEIDSKNDGDKGLDNSYSVGGKGTFNVETDTTESYNSDVANGTVSKYLIPNSQNGLLTIKGLDSREYEFTEVSTAPGRNLMADNFYVEIVAPKAPGNGKVADPKLENGKVAHAYVWTGQKPGTGLRFLDDISNYDVASYDATKTRLDIGRVPLTVQNNEVIKVLKTGGKGIWIYAGIGIGIIALGAILMRKKDKDEISSEPQV